MPTRNAQPAFEERVLDDLEARGEDVFERLAREAGPPAGATGLSERDEDEAWETTDDRVDYETMTRQLLTQGLPREVAQGLLIAKLRPDWLPLYAQPTQDAELAHALVRLAQYPFRASLLEDLDDPDEQVAKAERLDRRFQKRRTALVEQQQTAAGSYAGREGRAEP